MWTKGVHHAVNKSEITLAQILVHGGNSYKYIFIGSEQIVSWDNYKREDYLILFSNIGTQREWQVHVVH